MSFQYASWPLPANVLAGWSTRQSGYSSLEFSNNNIARHVGESLETVESNRTLLRSRLNSRPKISWLNQTHSTTVVEAALADIQQGQDGSYTKASGLACCVMTADCLPVFFWQHDGEQVAVAHAGWRGLADGMLLNTLAKFQDPRRVNCGIGPAISQQAFQVGREVKTAFASFPNAAQYFRKDADKDKYLCDLAGLAQAQLLDAGVNQVYQSEQCSYSQSELYYSYRRDGKTGRMANLIWKNN